MHSLSLIHRSRVCSTFYNSFEQRLRVYIAAVLIPFTHHHSHVQRR